MIHRLDIDATPRQFELIKDAIIRFCGEQSIDVVEVKVSNKEHILELEAELKKCRKI